MRAAKQFKRLLVQKRPELMESIFGRGSKIVQPPLAMKKEMSRSHSNSLDDRRAVEADLVSEGVHRDIKVSDNLERLPEDMDPGYNKKRDHANSQPLKPATWIQEAKSRSPHPLSKEDGATTTLNQDSGKGQAHDPLEDTLFLHIGPSSDSPAVDDSGTGPFVSESPGAVDINVYEMAYEEEVEKIVAAQQAKPKLFLNRRVEGTKRLREHEHIIDFDRASSIPKLGLSKLVDMAKSHVENKRQSETESDGSQKTGEKD
jgi:[calcium/calmodulin-dependent protein kinase] kinase